MAPEEPLAALAVPITRPGGRQVIFLVLRRPHPAAESVCGFPLRLLHMQMTCVCVRVRAMWREC